MISFCVLSCFSHVWLFAFLWTVAHQAPLSIEFSRQEYWSGLPCPPPGDFLDWGIKPTSPAASALQADSLPLSYQGNSWSRSSPPKAHILAAPPSSLSQWRAVLPPSALVSWHRAPAQRTWIFCFLSNFMDPLTQLGSKSKGAKQELKLCPAN